MPTLSGFFLLLLIALLVQLAGDRFLPLAMPSGRIRTVAMGWLGGLFGQWLASTALPLGPQLAGIYLLPAAAVSAIVILLFGLAPFLKILIGRV